MIRTTLALLLCISIAYADNKKDKRKAILNLLARCEAEAAKAWIDSPEHSRLIVSSVRLIDGDLPTEKCFVARTDTHSFQFLEQMCLNNFEEMIALLPETAASDLRCDHEHLAMAISKHARIKLDPLAMFKIIGNNRLDLVKGINELNIKTGKTTYTKQISEWYKNRHTVPKRFEAIYQNYTRTLVTDKGIISITTTKFNTLDGRIVNDTTPTDFGESLVELRSFGLDALPECIDRFEKTDYRLCWLFAELTDRRAAGSNILKDQGEMNIRWWRDTSPHAQALSYTLPALDAGKDFKLPEKKK